MNPEYHFCFAFNKIAFNYQTATSQDNYTTFKFQLLIDHNLMGSTRQIMCTPNQNCQIILQNLCLMLRINKHEIQTKSNCEIRFIAAEQGQQQKLIGCYEFELINYIKVYHELNRNCIELSIQIGVDMVIAYEVYLEITPEALRRIIDEHEAAKKNKIIEESNQTDSFQSHQIENYHRKGQLKEIQYDLLSPISLKHRFWSPKRNKRDPPTPTAKNLKKSELITKEQAVLWQKRQPFLKIRRTESSSSEFKPLQLKSQQSMTSVLEQLDVNNEEQQNDQNFIKLYEVIGNDSKVTLPGENDNYELYRSKADRKIQKKRQNNQDRGKNSVAIIKTEPNAKNNLKLYSCIILLILIVVMTTSLFLFRQKGVTSKRHKHKRRGKAMN